MCSVIQSFYQSECVDTAEDETTNFINHLVTKQPQKTCQTLNLANNILIYTVAAVDDVLPDRGW